MISLHVKNDRTKEIKSEMERALLAALEKCGEIGEGYAKDNLTQAHHVDTGNLRNSVTHKVVDKDCYIGTNVEYGKYIELGTGKYADGGRKTSWVYQDEKGNFHRTDGIKPDPWLKPAVTEHLDVYKKVFENIKDDIK